MALRESLFPSRLDPPQKGGRLASLHKQPIGVASADPSRWGKGPWWRRPAAGIPVPPPGRGDRLALAYETNGDRVREAAKFMAVFVIGAVASYLRYREPGSVIPPLVCGGLVLLFLLRVLKPVTISAGRHWLQVARGRRGEADWVCTSELALLEFARHRGAVDFEMRDRHGRKLSVSFKELRANNLVHALVMTSVRESYRQGMRTNDLAVRFLGLDRPHPGTTVAVDEEGNPVTTYFAYYDDDEGPGRPFAVVRRTPADPLPTDEVYIAGIGWEALGYSLHFDASRFDGGFVQVSGSRASQLVESLQRRLTELPAP
jgi:hypothetical protein